MTHCLIKKIAEQISLDMSYDVPDSEVRLAKSVVEKFKGISRALETALNKLDILYEVFKKHENISTEAIVERRGVFKGRFRMEVMEDYRTVLKRAFKAIDGLNFFAVDGDINQLISSFKGSIGELKDLVDEFTKMLRDDLEEPDLRNLVLTKIDSIRKKTKETDELIYDRIINHIEENIIRSSWANTIKDEFSYKFKEYEPYIVELYKEREGAINGTYSGIKPQQEMNPANMQKIHYPDHVNINTQFGER